MFALEVAVAIVSLDHGGGSGLRWSAPPSCPGAAEVRARVEELVGRPLGEVDLEIVGVVEASPPDAWALELSLGPPGEATRRRLVAARCATLADAAALLVAVHVAPKAGATALAWPDSAWIEARAPVVPAPAASAVPAAAAAPRPDPVGVRAVEAAPASRARRQRTWSLGLGLGAGVEVGALPGAASAIQAALVADRGRLRLALTGSFLLPRTRALTAPAGASARVLQGAVGLRTCVRSAWGRLTGSLCAGVELGAQEGVGRGVPAARRARSRWSAALVAPSLGWSLGAGAELVLGAELAAPFVRPRFVLAADHAGADVIVHTAAALSGRVIGGLVIRLPWRR